MRNPLAIHVETRVGVIIILCCAALAFAVVMRSISRFSSFLVLMNAQTSLTKSVARVEHDRINHWLEKQGLNSYGDTPGTVYAEGIPMFEDAEGRPIDRYGYLVRKFPQRPWKERK